MRKTTWAAILVLLLLQPLVAVILAFATKRQLSHLAFLSFVGSWVYVILQLAYKHWNRFYFLVESLRLRWMGAGVTWQAQAEYMVSAVDADLVRRVVQELRRLDTRSLILAEEPLRVAFQTNGITLIVWGTSAAPDMLPHDEHGHGTLIVTVAEGLWPFRTAVDLATTTVPSIFESARRIVTPTSEKYWSDITFTKGNPYFGFFLRNANFASIDRFTVDLHVPVPGDARPATVTAQKDHMTIVARKSTTLATISRRYLAMAG